jgi:hypothetical protein
MIRMTPLVVALCGKKQSGKDVAADLLVHHYNFKKIKIAESLKEGLRALFHFTDEQLEGDKKETIDQRWGVTPRQVMQFFGTEVMQYKLQEIMPFMSRNFFIRSLILKHLQHPLQGSYVISDLRFLHEYHALKNLENYRLICIRIERPVAQQQEDTHVSEMEYLQIQADHVIVNNGTVEELLVKLNHAISS